MNSISMSELRRNSLQSIDPEYRRPIDEREILADIARSFVTLSAERTYGNWRDEGPLPYGLVLVAIANSEGRMSGDLALLIVRSLGGFWQFRSRMVKQKRGSLLSKLMRTIYYAYLHRYGAYIGHSAVFASEPCFPHNLHGVFVAGNAKVGRNCVIFQQVTLGANAIPGSKTVGCPVIGDNVYIGAGAKIIGNVSVGDHCRIGANCVVTSDVPPNSLAVLSTPRILERDQPPDNRYFRWSPSGPIYFDMGEWILEKDPEVIERLKNAF